MKEYKPVDEFQFYMTSAISIASLFSLFSIHRHQKNIKKLERRIKFVSQQQVYTPSDLLDEFHKTSTGRGTRTTRFQPIVELDEQRIIGYKGQVLVKGKVEAEPGRPPFVSVTNDFFSKKIESVARIKYKEEIYSNDASDPQRGKYVINLKRILQNCQADFHKQFLVTDDRAQVIISNYDRINYEKALDIITYSQTRRHLMPHEFLFTLMVLSAKFVAQLFFKNLDVSSFRGISVGIRDSEVGIKIGSGIAVIGQVVYNLRDKTMRIDSPELILNERLSYLSDLKGQLDAALHNRNVWIVVGVVTGLYVARQTFKYLRKMNYLPEWVTRHLPN